MVPGSFAPMYPRLEMECKMIHSVILYAIGHIISLLYIYFSICFHQNHILHMALTKIGTPAAILATEIHIPIVNSVPTKLVPNPTMPAAIPFPTFRCCWSDTLVEPFCDGHWYSKHEGTKNIVHGKETNIDSQEWFPLSCWLRPVCLANAYHTREIEAEMPILETKVNDRRAEIPILVILYL